MNENQILENEAMELTPYEERSEEIMEVEHSSTKSVLAMIIGGAITASGMIVGKKLHNIWKNRKKKNKESVIFVDSEDVETEEEVMSNN